MGREVLVERNPRPGIWAWSFVGLVAATVIVVGATEPTPEAKRAQALRESRRRDSRSKRDRVSAALTAMLTTGEHVSFASVARRAGVSTWLAYAPGVREQIERAITRQASNAKRPAPTESAMAVRTDLELARQEIRRLRSERDDLHKHLQETLGRQLSNLTSAPLVERISTREP
jgi:hypothetical protein